MHRGMCYIEIYHTAHRRIQDFVRGGAKALLAPGGGGGKALLARASLFGGAIFCGEGGGPRPPWPPPGSAHAAWNVITPCVPGYIGLHADQHHNTQACGLKIT